MVTVARVWVGLPGPVRVLIGGRVLTLRPAPADGPVPPPCDEHLVAGPRETVHAWLSAADVIVAADTDPARLLAAHPGCLVAVAVTDQGCQLATGGIRARLEPVLGGTCTVDDATAYASALHAWLVTGGSPGTLDRLTLVRENTVTVVRVRYRRTAQQQVRRVAR